MYTNVGRPNFFFGITRLQLTPVEYQGRFAFLGRAKELRPCCLLGHSMIGRITERMGYPRNDLCRSCLYEEKAVCFTRLSHTKTTRSR